MIVLTGAICGVLGIVVGLRLAIWLEGDPLPRDMYGKRTPIPEEEIKP